MQGTKANWLEKQCRKRGRAYVRFDYRGHGESEGVFEDGTLTDWINDALLVLDTVAKPPVLPVGSSMGGFIALHAALKRPGKIAGLVGIATSPDFTQTIFEERMTDRQQNEMMEKGYILQPSDYREKPVKITKDLIEDGKNHLLLHYDKLDLNTPVCLIHGKQDADVPWQKSQKLRELIGEDKCKLILVPDGEHRLSRPKDLELIDKAVREIT